METSTVFVVAAVAKGNGIYGIDVKGKGSIPWHSKLDMQHFKELTEGHTVVMGFNTWKSLPVRPLPNRENIVISRNLYDDLGEGVVVCRYLPEAIQKAKSKKVFVIGEAKLWTGALLYASKLYITLVDISISETNLTLVCKELLHPGRVRNFDVVPSLSRRATDVDTKSGQEINLDFLVYTKREKPKPKKVT